MSSKARFFLQSLKLNFSEIDVPVKMGFGDHEIWVRPGDIIIGDADGTVCLPKSLAERVTALLPDLVSGTQL